MQYCNTAENKRETLTFADVVQNTTDGTCEMGCRIWIFETQVLLSSFVPLTVKNERCKPQMSGLFSKTNILLLIQPNEIIILWKTSLSTLFCFIVEFSSHNNYCHHFPGLHIMLFNLCAFLNVSYKMTQFTELRNCFLLLLFCKHDS